MYSITDSVILAHAPDYHVNLIAPKEMSDNEINEFHSNLREVMLYIKYSKDKQTLNKVIKEDIKFQSMERQAAEVINVVTGSKLKYPEGKGDVNMCLAIQQMREESEIKGAVEAYKDLEISLTDTIKRIAEKFHLSEGESSKAVLVKSQGVLRYGRTPFSICMHKQIGTRNNSKQLLFGRQKFLVMHELHKVILTSRFNVIIQVFIQFLWFMVKNPGRHAF